MRKQPREKIMTMMMMIMLINTSDKKYVYLCEIFTDVQLVLCSEWSQWSNQRRKLWALFPSTLIYDTLTPFHVIQATLLSLANKLNTTPTSIKPRMMKNSARCVTPGQHQLFATRRFDVPPWHDVWESFSTQLCGQWVRATVYVVADFFVKLVVVSHHRAQPQ